MIGEERRAATGLPRALWLCDVVVWVRPPHRAVHSNSPAVLGRHEGRSILHNDTGFLWRSYGIGFFMETTTTRALADHDGTNDDAGPGGPRRHEGRSSPHNGTGFFWKPYGIVFRNHNVWILFCLEGNVLDFLFGLEGLMLLVVLVFFLSVWKTILLLVGVGRLEFLFSLEGVMSLAVLVFFGLLHGRQGGAIGS